MDSNPILIAVLGVTGAGKTTFISKSTGREDLEIGYGIESCSVFDPWVVMATNTRVIGTQDISVSTLTIDDKKVTLIDTPGFDDTYRSDADVLEGIAEFLSGTYASGMLLTGVILLQPVTGNRAQGSEKRRLKLFEKICGPDAYSHVVIATTMWSDLANRSTGERQVQQRKELFWPDMIEGGSQVMNHDNTEDSAISIIRKLVDKGKVELQMQIELARNRGMLSATAAGQQMHSDLEASCRMLASKLAKMTAELQKSNEMWRRANEEKQEEINELRERIDDLMIQKARIEERQVGRSRFLLSDDSSELIR